MLRKTLIALAVLTPSFSLAQEGKTREEEVREDRARIEAEALWIYNDIPEAFARARHTGKPILVAMRCVPCEQCVKLDEELIERNPVIAPLLKEFVLVRQISTNGLDLDLFQFDTDQSFAVFMLNAEGAVYGRFGTRSHRTEWREDVSVAGLAKAMQAALDLHAEYPANKPSLEGKRGEPFEVDQPEQFDSLKGRFTDQLNFGGNVVQSCIHCHQIGDARRDLYRKQGKPIPESIFYPSPSPKVVGLTLDPQEMATVKSVESGSAADDAGFRAGDRIERVAGQPMLSIADVQWVLDAVAPEGGEVAAEVARGDESVRLTMALDEGWRRRGDISWRVSSWGLRRMASGGLVLETLPSSERAQLRIQEGSMALVVTYVGQYNEHAAAKRAGFKKGDVIVEFDGRRDLMRESDLLQHGVTARRAGDEVPVTVLREDKKLQLTMPMQL